MTRGWLATALMALAAMLAMTSAAWGEQLMMVRSTQSFPEAMSTLQTSITDHGYKVSRVQRVDIGLTGNGFKTDKYRIVFFGKPQEVRELTRRYPELIPYLPWPITIFAEGEQTLAVTANPADLRALDTTPELHAVLQRWHNDIRSILEDVRNAE